MRSPRTSSTRCSSSRRRGIEQLIAAQARGRSRSERRAALGSRDRQPRQARRASLAARALRGSTSSSFRKPISASARPPEEGATFVENALAKARHAARASGLPAIADDSGLMRRCARRRARRALRAVRGRSGRRSRRTSRSCSTRLRSVPDAERGARFYCVLVALGSADDPAPLIAAGEWRGRIAALPRGTGGFGYDPVFVDPATGLTAARAKPGSQESREPSRPGARARSQRPSGSPWRRRS